jgi:hypothetical protein
VKAAENRSLDWGQQAGGGQARRRETTADAPTANGALVYTNFGRGIAVVLPVRHFDQHLGLPGSQTTRDVQGTA